ncbi:MAG: tetratricopeptide repeat protein [Candidatus Aminicenantes bacterium]|jgi:tetratricopeptide (TPR) repeat protein
MMVNSAMGRKIVVFVLFGILVLFHQMILSQEQRTTVEKALNCLDFLNYKEALVFISQAFEENPTIKGLRFYKAFARFQLGHTEEAVQILNEEIKKFPDSLYSYVLLSYIAFLQNKTKEAVQAGLDFDVQLNRAYRVHNWYHEGPFKLKMKFYNMGLPYFIVGLHYKNSEKYGNAIRYFGFALRGEYNPVECYCQMIDTELVRENWKRALSRAQQAVKRAGSQPEFSFLLAYTHYRLGDLEEAISNFKEAIRLRPYFIEGIRNLGIIYLNQNKYDDAAPLFIKALKIRPNDTLSQSYLEKSLDQDQAKKDFGKLPLTKDIVDSVKLKYRYPIKGDIVYVSNVINSRALTFVREGKLTKAKKMLGKFLEINKAPAQLYYNLGQIHNMFGEYEDALQNAHKAVELKKDFKGALDLIGNIYFKLEDYENSLQAYKKAAAPHLADAMGFYNLGCAHHALGQLEEAEKCWKNAIRFDRGAQRIEESEKKSEDELSVSVTVHKEPASLKAHKSLGKLFLDQRLSGKALKHYKSAYKLSPNDPELCFMLGKIYFSQNKWADALFYLEKHVFLGGDDAQEAKKLIGLINKKKPPVEFIDMGEHE